MHFIGVHGMVGKGGRDGSEFIDATWKEFQQNRTTSIEPTKYNLTYNSVHLSDLSEILGEVIKDPRTLKGTAVAVKGLFDSSNGAGVSEIGLNIAETLQSCADTQFVLVGYSQGAWVIDKFLRSTRPQVLNHIAGVALYGDPQWDNGRNGRGIARQLSRYISTLRLGGDYPGFGDRIQSWCAARDPVCGEGYRPGLLSAGQEVGPQLRDAVGCDKPACPHNSYSGVTTKGGEFLGRKVYPK
ncbi:cutinase family protein [Streptomyces sp. NPDC048825]|uniref:cutinase family protein n=1 Tax=Streptomyces sp. NPDC048825 TaxID=3365592 RepID=UPI003724289B